MRPKLRSAMTLTQSASNTHQKLIRKERNPQFSLDNVQAEYSCQSH